MIGTTTRAHAAAQALAALLNNRDLTALDRLSPDYVHHGPVLPADRAGVREFVASLHEARMTMVEPQRVIAAGDLAAVHSRYNHGAGLAVVDIMRFDAEGRIAEHWTIAQDLVAETASGNDMLSGGGNGDAPVDETQLAANIAAMERLFGAFRSGDTDTFDAVISAESYIQHNPLAANGLDAVKAFFGSIGPVDVDLLHVIGAGDLVLAHAHYKSHGTVAADIFRFDPAGKIVEHWDVHQPATGMD